VSAPCCCWQLLWVKYQLEDYSSIDKNIPVYYDNTSVIILSKNPIYLSKPKYIEIRYYFICDYLQKGVFDIKLVDTKHQRTNIFTKPLFEDCYVCIREYLNMVSLSD